MIDNSGKLIVILGPTASGKTSLALDLAEEFGGEIVCADSKTVYRGMNIGTAKPTSEEQARVQHHLLDILDPGERLSAAAFKRLAEGAIADIRRRGRIPFLVGGSGLYIDAVVFDYDFPPEADPARRKYLESLDDGMLQELLAAEDPDRFAVVDVANRRRVIRALETVGQAGARRSLPRSDVLLVGLALNNEVIQNRIEQRADKMLHESIVEEARILSERWGWDNEAMKGPAYQAVQGVVMGAKSLAEARADMVRADMQLVKKQRTWFKRNPAIQWADDPEGVRALVAEFLRR